jgi:hypothetical protein
VDGGLDRLLLGEKRDGKNQEGGSEREGTHGLPFW